MLPSKKVFHIIFYNNHSPIQHRLQRRAESFELKNIKPSNSNHNFSYIEHGCRSKDRPTMVFVHGFSAFKEGILDTCKFIPKHKYHIVAVDLPGHGMTTGDSPKDVGISYIVHELNKVGQDFLLQPQQISRVGEGCT